MKAVPVWWEHEPPKRCCPILPPLLIFVELPFLQVFYAAFIQGVEQNRCV